MTPAAGTATWKDHRLTLKAALLKAGQVCVLFHAILIVVVVAAADVVVVAAAAAAVATP